MKKFLLILTVLSLLIPMALTAQRAEEFQYLSEEEYSDLSSNEREIYWQNLENELLSYQQRKADAVARTENYRSEIEDLRARVNDVQEEYDQVHQRVVNYLNISDAEFASMREQMSAYNNSLNNWANLSDSEIVNIRKDLSRLKSNFERDKDTNAGKHPDLRGLVVEISNKISNLEETIERVAPSYYEDEYTVERGDYLSKIAGYSFIYGDSSKWGIIYRANRDQIRDPNLIYPNQVLKIPRGLPNTWKVYRGEYLWKIASYPEVYGQGSKWPLIYRANQDKIQNPDLIYPNQVFTIPRD